MDNKNKKQVIIGVTALLLVTLTLLGLTYAYYRTRIIGNTNEKSVSLTSKKLEVTYQNESAVIAPTEKIVPGYTASKTFEVKNTGSESVSYGIILDNITNTFARDEDWTYTLTNTRTNEEYTGIIPTGDSYIVNTISIASNVTDEYTLEVTYANLTDVDQSIDMGKNLSLRINIADATGEIFESASEGTLLKAIGNDKLISSPLSIPGQEISLETEAVLASTEDDYGTSYYYRGKVEDNYVTFADMCWRIVRIEGDGSIKLILEDQDEVCSASMNGNWAIPTTTGGENYYGNFGYTLYNENTLTASDGTQNSGIRYLMDYLHGQTNSDKSMATAFKNFQSTFTETEISKLKAGNWCLGDNAYDSSGNLLNSTQKMDNIIKGTEVYYDSYQRLYKNNPKQPTLKCKGTIMNDWDDAETNPTPMYVGAITADEIVYAGGKSGTLNPNYYLINEEFKKGYSGANKSYHFWSLSPSYFYSTNDGAFFLVCDGRVYSSGTVNSTSVFRPSVSLASSAVITGGEGTIDAPYVIG